MIILESVETLNHNVGPCSLLPKQNEDYKRGSFSLLMSNHGESTMIKATFEYKYFNRVYERDDQREY